MPFSNENTLIKMRAAGNEAEFDRLYDKATRVVKETYFGKEYPILTPEEKQATEKFEDISPIDGKSIGKFQMASEEDLNSAVKALKKNQKSWYNKGYFERAQTLIRAAELMSERKFEFSALLAYENGKGRYEAMGDVDEAIDFIKYYAMNLIENQGFERFTGKAYENEETFSIMKPYGVFAVIAPFNFFSITVGMTAGPLVVGNTVLLKPSSDIPLSSYLFIKLLHEAGVPKEAVAYLTGSGSRIGNAISSHEDISGIVFTGSKDTGMNIFHTATSLKPKVVVTEMGGKDAIIVSDKADLEKATDGVMKSAFGFSGQKCSACSVAYIQENIYDRFMEKLLEKVKRLKPTDPREKSAVIVPVVNSQAFDKYKGLIEKLQVEGKVLTGGRVLEQDGYYVEPTIVADVKDNSFLLSEELFLPILAITKYRDLDGAISKINQLDYGLTGGIFTEDSAEIKKYFDNIEVGVIYANRSSGGSSGAMVGSQAFVGWKMSGSTGKGTGSFYYLTQFLREQSQTIAH